jgi:hypothetical protein
MDQKEDDLPRKQGELFRLDPSFKGKSISLG